MTENFNELLQEVQKDIQQEKLVSIWNKYQKYFFYAIGILFIVFFGVNKYVENQQHEKIYISDKYLQAQEYLAVKQTEKALKILETIAQKDSKAYHALARLLEAKVFVDKGSDDFKKGQKILQDLYSDHKNDAFFRSFSKAVYLNNEIEMITRGQDPEKISEDTKVALRALLSIVSESISDTTPLKIMFLEIKGLILVLLDQQEDALNEFLAIAQTSQCPRGLKLRAELMIEKIKTHIKNLA
ncbi:MAG: hypothetical protein C0432_02220 [Candidatus Puniceispirillum sp.]|nr:hypothetical protein [Candidatus Pelagibacter sp.]MBA4283091.1 hypothetical protein [Candidatus Puniceispirillum sp.]